MGVSINTSKFLGVTTATSIQPPKASGFTNVDSLLLGGVVGQRAESNAAYTALNGLSKASFSFWVKPITGGSGLRYVFHIGKGGTGFDCQVAFWLYAGNRVQFDNSNSGMYTRGSNTLTYGSWNHVAITCDGTQSINADKTRIYINGTDVTTSPSNLGGFSTFVNATDELYVGESKTGQYNPLNGNVDEFAIFSGVQLTPIQVTNIYNQGGTAKPGDLMTLSPQPSLWWRMGDNDGGTGTALTDAAGSTNGTLVNSASYTTDVP
jgi:hypothetical protein